MLDDSQKSELVYYSTIHSLKSVYHYWEVINKRMNGKPWGPATPYSKMLWLTKVTVKAKLSYKDREIIAKIFFI